MIKQHPSFRGEEGEDGVCLGGHLLGLRQGAMFLQKWWLCEMDNQFDSGSDESFFLSLIYANKPMALVMNLNHMLKWNALKVKI